MRPFLCVVVAVQIGLGLLARLAEGDWAFLGTMALLDLALALAWAWVRPDPDPAWYRGEPIGPAEAAAERPAKRAAKRAETKAPRR
jgi:hypothetical protein